MLKTDFLFGRVVSNEPGEFSASLSDIDVSPNVSLSPAFRVSLARCVYSRAHTLYLDDILSAVDANTAQYLYKFCIQGDLLKNRRIAMVSHNINLLLPTADFAIHFEKGSIAKAGARDEFCLGDPTGVEATNRQPEDLAIAENQSSTVESGDTLHLQRIQQVYKEESRPVGLVDWQHHLFLLNAAGGLYIGSPLVPSIAVLKPSITWNLFGSGSGRRAPKATLQPAT